MPPSVPSPASPSLPPPSSSRIPRRRWLVASALLLGGLLTGVAPFLPWVQFDLFPFAGEPARTYFAVPAQVFAALVYVLVFSVLDRGSAPDWSGIAATVALVIFVAFVFWGVPMALAARGAAVLWKRHAVPTPGTWISSLIFVAVGVAGTIFLCWLYLLYLFAGWDTTFFTHPEFRRPTLTLEYGLGVSLLGYLCALVGTVWLAFLPRPSRR
jgi:hypothetical protein